jgi:feruloyl esterase
MPQVAFIAQVPGRGHCGGGEGATDRFDTVAALEQWVERGVAPSRIVASHQANASTDRTRPPVSADGAVEGFWQYRR